MKNFDAPFHCYLVLLLVGPIHQIHKINSNIAEFQYIEKHKKNISDFGCYKVWVQPIYRKVCMGFYDIFCLCC